MSTPRTEEAEAGRPLNLRLVCDTCWNSASKNSLSHYYYYHYNGAPRSDHAALAGLELTMQTKLASNSYRSAYSGSQVLGLNLSSFSGLIKNQSVSLCVQAQTTACLQRSRGNPGESVLSFHNGGDLGAKLKLSGLAQAPLKRLHPDVIHAGTNMAAKRLSQRRQ